MDTSNLGRVAGAAGFVLMITRLRRLIESGGDAPAWLLIMVSAAFLGAVIWWLLSQTTKSAKLGLALYTVAGFLLFLRVAVSHTLIGGFFPSSTTFAALAAELNEALDVIAFGVAPVFPTSGVVALLSALMWIVGGLFMWGSLNSLVPAMVVPSLGLYLQFAVMDRRPAGLGWMIPAGIVFALSITAMATERRTESGRARNLEGRPLPRRRRAISATVAAVVAAASIGTAVTAAGLVPLGGNFDWRLGGGYGEGLGGVSFDRLADLQQRLIRRSNAVMFRATLSDNAPPAARVYWRMETLDTFDGVAWRPSTGSAEFYEPGRAGGNPDQRYRGTTARISQRVQIEDLRSQVVPTAGITNLLQSENVNVDAMQIARDGSVIYQSQLGEGDEYQVEASLPLYADDLGAMASDSTGELTPLFANATANGDFQASPGLSPDDLRRPAGIEFFLELPEEMPVSMGVIAREHTTGAASRFEQAWLLQYWLRDSGDFTYSTEVTTGHGSLDLESWLTDPTSTNYRTGYCEQYAATMAVLGRAIGLPTRVVWGFTPGSVETQSDGTEVIVVRDRNAHAWVEVWIDGFGWVQFDPTPRGDGALPASITARFDPTTYLAPPDPSSTPADRPDVLEDPSRGFIEEADPGGLLTETTAGSIPWLILLAGIVVVGLVPSLKFMRRRRRMTRLREGDISGAWEEITDRLSDLGAAPRPDKTPVEFARDTDSVLMPLAIDYSAAIYGGIQSRLADEDIQEIEDWLKVRFDSRQRTRALFSLKSILRP